MGYHIGVIGNRQKAHLLHHTAIDTVCTIGGPFRICSIKNIILLYRHQNRIWINGSNRCLQCVIKSFQLCLLGMERNACRKLILIKFRCTRCCKQADWRLIFLIKSIDLLGSLFQCIGIQHIRCFQHSGWCQINLIDLRQSHMILHTGRKTAQSSTAHGLLL